MFDVQALRRSFPGLDPDWAFFDNAGGTFPAAQVVRRVTEHLERWPVQLGATYPRSVEAQARVAAGRAAAARLVHAAAPEECIFGASTTMNAQLLARALAPSLRPGDAVVVSEADHEANIGPWMRLASQGVEVRTWNVDPSTLQLEADDLRALLADGRVKLVAFTHVSNVLGTVQDVAALAALAREHGALSCVDGVAYAPHRRVDVQALGVDFYLVSLYKVFGPHVGLLWGRAEALRALASQNHDFVPQGQLPQMLEPGNPGYESVAAVPGIIEHLEELGRSADAGASDPLDAAFDAVARHEEGLAEILLASLRARPDVTVIGLPEADRTRRVAVVSFSVQGLSSRAIAEALEADRLAVRYGHFYARRLVEGLGLLEQDGVVRVSLVHTNTEEELTRLVGALDRVLEQLPRAQRVAGGA